eukprot:3966721-Amphidinium_carterae.2
MLMIDDDHLDDNDNSFGQNGCIPSGGSNPFPCHLLHNSSIITPGQFTIPALKWPMPAQVLAGGRWRNDKSGRPIVSQSRHGFEHNS